MFYTAGYSVSYNSEFNFLSWQQFLTTTGRGSISDSPSIRNVSQKKNYCITNNKLFQASSPVQLNVHGKVYLRLQYSWVCIFFTRE